MAAFPAAAAAFAAIFVSTCDHPLAAISAYVESPRRKVDDDAVPLPSLAAPTVPLAKLLAFRAVRLAPDMAGRLVNVPVNVPVVVRFSLSKPKLPVDDVMVPVPEIVTLIPLTPT